jgi:hypothetical protein
VPAPPWLRTGATAPPSAPVLPSQAMPTVPIDEGPRDRRRVGPFWLEEGTGLVVVGAVILLAFAALYTLAVINR